MKSYTVYFERTIKQSAQVYIEANSQYEAEDSAWNEDIPDKDWKLMWELEYDIVDCKEEER